jgi:hypothetical protein
MNRSANFLWLALLVMIPLGLTWEYYPLSDASARLDKFPRNTGQVQSSDLAMSPSEMAVFHDVDVVKRLAVEGEDRAVVTIIDGTRDRHAVHDPAFCFRGAGWEVTGQESIPLANGRGRLLHLRQDGYTAEALYWFSDGARQFDRPLVYWWKTSLRRLTLGRSGSEPVLVVLTSAGDMLPHWQQLLKAWPELQSL